MDKRLIEQKLEDQDIEEAERLLLQYESECPDDADLLTLKENYYLLRGDLEQALECAKQGVRRLPLNGDMQYNLAYVYELLEDWISALICYGRAGILYGYNKEDDKYNTLFPLKKVEELVERFVEETKKVQDREELDRRLEILDRIATLQETLYGFEERSFRSYKQVIGTYLYEDIYTKRYVAIYKDLFQGRCHDDKDEMLDLVHLKAEFLKVTEGTGVRINIEDISADTQILLPIAVENNTTAHVFTKEQQEYIVPQYARRHFNYYAIKNGTTIQSSGTSYYGRPIPLQADPKKKRLVLSLFVDGLAQMILSGDDFKEHMPNTYRFFSKGTICTRAYNAAEWTYPSLVNLVAGLDTTHHMMYHNELDTTMPEEYPTLAEYFHNEGYYTCYMGGDWRIVPTYGHARGYDRFIYQHQKSGFKVNEVMIDALDHLETFKETNQYCWFSVGDLHDIADEDDLPILIQRDLELSDRVLEERSVTSAKQNYNPHKIKSYLKMAHYIDRWLQYLYSFIEENYTDDEIVISVFADHGQGYFIQNPDHFIGRERSNIAMMFRGSQATGVGMTDELISSKDYNCTMRKLAGLTDPGVPNDGHVPKVFGGTESWEDVLTESIHPKDPYRATIFAKGVTFFFENPAPVQTDGRFELTEYRYWMEDEQDQVMENSELGQKYLQKVLKHIAPLLIYK